MSVKGKLDKLQRAMRGGLESFELANGQRYYFDPEEAFKITFSYFSNCLRTDWKREARPEPPELLQAVADAKDRREALDRVMGGSSFLVVDREALVERGEFVPRSLVAGREYGDLGVTEDLSE